MARIPKLDSAGRFLAADVNAQIDARAKAATAPLLDGKRGVEATELGTEHLDTVTTPGTYTQSANLEATLETGYPMTRGGVLQVERSVSKTMVWQTYTTYAPTSSTPPQTWQRGSYNGTWTPWARVGGGVDGSVPIFPTLAEATAWEAANPGKKAFYLSDPVTGADTSGVVADSDTTGPTGATLTVSNVLASGYTVTVAGAVDVETGLHATAPYAFSADGGTTWTAWQAGTSYSFTGLDAGTAYPAPKVKVRNQSTPTDETVFTATSGVTTKSGVTFQTAVSDPAATFAWNMDEAAGATAFANTGTDTTSAGPITATVGTPGARAGLVGYVYGPDFTGSSAGNSVTIASAALGGKTSLTAMAVFQIDAMTAYGAETFSGGPVTLRINADRTLEAKVALGAYYTVFSNPKSSALAASNAELLGKTLVVHVRYSANPDETAVFFQGQKVATDTYAAALAKTTVQSADAPNSLRGGSNAQRFNGSFDGTMNSARMWLGTALTDAEILSHARAAGVA